MAMTVDGFCFLDCLSVVFSLSHPFTAEARTELVNCWTSAVWSCFTWRHPCVSVCCILLFSWVFLQRWFLNFSAYREGWVKRGINQTFLFWNLGQGKELGSHFFVERLSLIPLFCSSVPDPSSAVPGLYFLQKMHFPSPGRVAAEYKCLPLFLPLSPSVFWGSSCSHPWDLLGSWLLVSFPSRPVGLSHCSIFRNSVDISLLLGPHFMNLLLFVHIEFSLQILPLWSVHCVGKQKFMFAQSACLTLVRFVFWGMCIRLEWRVSL